MKSAHATAPAYSIVVPAHNEGGVIGATLRAMRRTDGNATAPDLIIVCNGCTDDTAEQAAAAAPDARVIAIEQASKIAAINTGLALAQHAPVLIVDADIRIGADLLDALAIALHDGDILAASPVPRIDSSASSALVKAYYRVWETRDYLRSGVGGSGVYGLSREGLRQLGRFPDILGDDAYVRALFPLSGQKRIETGQDGGPLFSVVRAPESVGSLLACEARWRSGDAQIKGRTDLAPFGVPGRRRQKVTGAPMDLLIYYGIKVTGRLLFRWNALRGRRHHWHRDNASRRRNRLDT